MSLPLATGIPPKSVTSILRVEGATVFIAMLATYQLLGGNWWLFALLILAPDLSMIGFAGGEKRGAQVYNVVHTYTAPLVLAAIAWLAGFPALLPLAVIWAAHIGADRAIGYGLKYPESFKVTHLGAMGRMKKAQQVADPT
ncbi:MAG: DUF4260 domain-containing protein [Devosia sp.]